MTGWSQAETARRLHVSAAAVSQFVNGHATPGRATLSLLKLLVTNEPSTTEPAG